MKTIQKVKATIRGRIKDGSPNPVDVHVGKRIRLRRMLLGYSQQQLAMRLGLTFQQVQKYEKGYNRVGASRLWDMSRVLRVQMDFFFENMDDVTAKQSPMMLGDLSDEEKSDLKHSELKTSNPMDSEEILKLVRAFYKIKNRKLASSLFNLMEQLSLNNR
jgi:transcriptional regulator with XRE-family HTH domain